MPKQVLGISTSSASFSEASASLSAEIDQLIQSIETVEQQTATLSALTEKANPKGESNPLLYPKPNLPASEMAGPHNPMPEKKKPGFINGRKDFKASEILTIESGDFPADQMKIEIYDSKGNKLDVFPEMKNGYWVIPKPNRMFTPGKYSIKIFDSSVSSNIGNAVPLLEQDFTWGVLALNVNKSIYFPNEKANISIGVLDEKGEMVCDAKVGLSITDPHGQTETLTTENQAIYVNPECQSHDFTLKPDYAALYSIKDPGNYRMELSAKTENGTYTIQDEFEVKEKVPFDVERISATRIYPLNAYPVIFNITAYEDFTGTITETVSGSFEITEARASKKHDIVEEVDGDKAITWSLNLKKGKQVQLGYYYDAPDISPEFYLLGPLTFTNDQREIIFEEARQWQIASDAVPTFSVAPAENPASYATTPTNVGANVTFQATASTGGSQAWYLAICKTNSVTANKNAAPTCAANQTLCVSAETASTTQASCAYTALAADAESIAWYGFACNKASSSYGCTAANQGSGNSGSPFIVNHRPSFSAVSNDGPKVAGQTLTWSSTASDTDTNGSADTVTLYVCKGNDFTGTACGAAGEWCHSAASASNPTCNITAPAGGTYNAYVYVIDNHNLAASGGSQATNSSFTTTNPPLNLSGHIYSAEPSTAFNCSANNLTLSFSINGAAPTTTTCTAADGSWGPFSVTAASGNIINVWVSGQGTGTVYGETVFVSDGAQQTNIDLFQNTLLVRHDTGTNITNANMGTGRYSTKGQQLYTVSAGALTVDQGIEFHIPASMTYAPGANSTFGGSYHNLGTATWSTSTATFNATSGSKTLTGNLNGTSAFYKVNFNGSGGGWTIQDAMIVDSGAANATDTFQVTNGTVTLGNGTGDSLEVSGGRFTVANGATFTTYNDLGLNQSVILDINHNTSPDNCSNCYVAVDGTMTINKKVNVRLNSGASVQSGFWVSDTGNLSIQGSSYGPFTATSGTDETYSMFAYLYVGNQGWTDAQYDGMIVRMASGLAYGARYSLMNTYNNSNNNYAEINGATSDYVDLDPTLAGSDNWRTFTSSRNMIGSNDQWVGNYLYDMTANKRFLIADSVNNGSNDVFSIIAEPDNFSGIASGDDIKLIQGIRPGDTFEILDYAQVTGNTNAGYIYGTIGSDITIQNASISGLGADVVNKYGIYTDADGTGTFVLDRSNIDYAYKGVILSSSASNKAISNNSIHTSENTSSQEAVWNLGIGNIITGNRIYHDGGRIQPGIKNDTGSNNTTVSGNYIYNFGVGVLGYSGGQLIYNNYLFKNGSPDGQIFTQSADAVVIYNNKVFDSLDSGAPGIYFTDYDQILAANKTFFNPTEGIRTWNSGNATVFFNNESYKNANGVFLRGDGVSVVTAYNENYGVGGDNSTVDFVTDSNAQQARYFKSLFDSPTEATGIGDSNDFFVSFMHDNTAGSTKVWNDYVIPDDIAGTPNNEGDQKFNYADNLWEDTATKPAYSGTGTEDTNLGITFTTALSTTEWYRATLTTAATNGGTFTIYRSGSSNADLTANPSTYNIASGTYTEASTGVQFTIQDGATDYALGDTYIFAVFPASGDADNAKTVVMMQDGDQITAGSGETLELKGESAALNETIITRNGGVSGSGGYHINIAGTIDAQYYQMRYLGGTGGGLGLDLQSGATITNIADGTFANFVNVGATDSFIRVHTDLIGTGAPTKEFYNLSFSQATSNPEYTITEAGGSAPSNDRYWQFTNTTCSGWASCEDSDSEQNTTSGGSIRFATLAPASLNEQKYRFAEDGDEPRDWYNANWGYRKPIDISNPNASVLTDFQVLITTATNSLVSGGKLQSDCDDLRFTSADGSTVLSYWIESGCNTATTKIWVKIPSVPASNTMLIYMYYGYGSATIGSNGDNTFMLYDNFNDNSIDTNKWTVVKSGGTPDAVETNGEVQISGDGSNRAYLRSKNTFGSSYRLEYKAKKTENIETVVHWDNTTGSWGLISNGYYAPQFASWDLNQCYLQEVVNAANVGSTVVSCGSLDNAYHDYQTIVKGSGQFEVMLDGASLVTYNDATPVNTSGYLAFSSRESPAAVNSYYDDVRVRQYVASEPSVTLGSETGKPTGSASSWLGAEDTGVTVAKNTSTRVRFLVNNTGGTNISPTFRLQVAPKGGAGNCEAVASGSFSDVPTTAGSAVAVMTTSSSFADGDATTHQMTMPYNGSNTWTAGKMVEHPSNTTGAVTLTGSNFTEIEYNFQITNNAADDTVYCFRAVNTATPLDTYTKVAQLTTAHVNQAPSAPQTPYVSNDNAQLGDPSPVSNLYNLTPVFSAIYDDPETSDTASAYEIQVGTDADWTAYEKWGSGKVTLDNPLAENTRSADITYGATYTGGPLYMGQTYYWRIKFWDNSDAEGAWSATQQFSINPFTVGGNIYQNDGSSDTTEYTVALANTAGVLATTTSSGGSYTFSNVPIADNDRFVVYIQGHTNNANAITVITNNPGTNITDIANLHLYVGKYAVYNHNGGQTADNDVCLFTSYPQAADALASCSGSSPTFSGDLLVASGVTYDAQDNTTTISGSYQNNGNVSWSGSTVTFNSTAAGNTLSGTMNGSSGFNKVKFDGVGGEWTIKNPMVVSAANTADTLLINNGTVTVGDSDGDSLEVNGKTVIAGTAGQTATLQTAALPIGQSVTIDINNNSSPQTCANCIMQVGQSAGADSGQGSLKITKNAVLRLNPSSGSDTKIEVEKTGYLEVQGSQDDTGTSNGTTDETTLTATVKNWTPGEHTGKYVRITNVNSLAFGKIYQITDNGATTLTRSDTSSADSTIASITGSGSEPTRTICSAASNLIAADNEGIGRYLRDQTTPPSFYLIVDSTNNDTNCSNNDSFVITANPGIFDDLAVGHTIDISDGIRDLDTFEILEYAHVTAENGIACNAHMGDSYEAYIWAKAGSETKIQYGDICNLGKFTNNKYGLVFNSVNGINSNEGMIIDTSRIHHGYYGIYLDETSNNNDDTAKGITNNEIYNNDSIGIGLTNANNNNIGKNLINSGSNGINVCTSDNNSMISNYVFNSPTFGYGIYLYSNSNSNILTTNKVYTRYLGIILSESSGFNTVTSNHSFSNYDGIYLNNNSNNNIVKLNQVYNNSNHGFESRNSSGNNILDSNNSFNNSFFGFIITDSNNNILLSNQSQYNSYAGIYLESVNDTLLYENQVHNETDGIKLINSNRTTSVLNQIYSNGTGLYPYYSPFTSIYDIYGLGGANTEKDLTINPEKYASQKIRYPLYGMSYSQMNAPRGGYSLASGKNPSDVIGVMNTVMGNVAYFYNNGTFSISDQKLDLTEGSVNAPTLHSFTLATGKTVNQVVGMTLDTNLNGLTVFYNDGTFSISENTFDGSTDIAVPNLHSYNVSSGHSASDVIGVTMEDWNYGRMALFYDDGTYSVSGNWWDGTQDISAPTEYTYTLAAGKVASDVLDFSFDEWGQGVLAVWYDDYSYSASPVSDGVWEGDASISLSDLYDSGTPNGIAAYQSNGSTGNTSIWGNYYIPSANAETPQSEETAKFNYANNLWEDSITDPGYAGTGSSDPDLNLGFNGGSLGGGSSAYIYRIVCKNANCVTNGTDAWDVYRDEVDTGDATTGSTYTDGDTNVQFKIDDVGTDYVLGDTYMFVAYKGSGDANTQKTITFMDDGASLTAPSGTTLELKGQSAGSNETILTRDADNTGGYHVNVAGTLDAQYYQMNYLGGVGGGLGLDLQSGATITNLANGTFGNFVNVDGTDTFIRVHSDLIGTGAPTKDFSTLAFTQASSNPEYTVTESGGSAPADDRYWQFTDATCTGWANCEVSDSEQNTNNGGSIRYSAPPNSSPVVTNVSLNNDSLITLTENTTTSVSFTADVTDANTYNDITTVSGKVYRSGVAGGKDCTPNDNRCYDVASCSLSGCSGDTCTATCTADIQFFAEPTDGSSSYAAQSWIAYVLATDSVAQTGEDYSPADTTDVATLRAINITSTLSYGELQPGADTASSNQSTVITNTGNSLIDIQLQGSDLTNNGSIILPDNQEYSLSNFSYGEGSALSNVLTLINVDLAKPTTTPSDSATTLYWGIGVPTGKASGEYTGTTAILAAPDQ